MRTIQALPVVLTVAALAGCGGSSGGSSTSDASGATQSAPPPAQTQAQTSPTTTAKSSGPDGAQIFASAGCVGCHTLKAANASGNVGPNLDELQPSFEAVKTQVTNGGGPMPAFKGTLSPAEIDAVARYVSENAGR
ncbi:MAG TPA: c-type cytochrome [Conexibacter sp.]|nr:c-type cytochrome [Conexibacter sp.]